MTVSRSDIVRLSARPHLAKHFGWILLDLCFSVFGLTSRSRQCCDGGLAFFVSSALDPKSMTRFVKFFRSPLLAKTMPCINSELRKLGSSNNLPSMHRLKSFRKIHGPLGYKGFGFATACDLGHDWWSNPSASKSMKLISPNVDPYNDRPLKRPYSKKTTTKSRGFWTLLKW